MPGADQTVVRLQRVIALAAFALVASTCRLWTPETEFPQIPWFGWARSIPPIVDRIALAGLAGSGLFLLVAATNARLRTAALWLFSASLMTLFLPSQHRLQPWAYEFLLLTVTLALAPPAYARRLLRWLVASIYIHSALSKIDVAFFESQGAMLLDGLLSGIHLSDEFWSEQARYLAIGLFPAGELVIGIGLLVPSVRTPAVFGSCLLHVLLLLTLGPWGLDHRPGVLIWNMYFIVQNWILFRPVRQSDEATADANPGSEPANWSIRSALATAIIAAAILCPLLQNRGWYDAWPSWAVYSSRPSQVTFSIASDRVDELPAGLRKFVGPSEPLTDWRGVNLDAWSFDTLNCPIYPEERFRIAVIGALTELTGGDIRVIVHGPPDRWSGRRQTTEITGSDALREFSAQYRMNTLRREQ